MQFYFSCTNNSHQYNVLFIAVDDLNDWVGFMDGNQQTRTLLDLCDLPLKKTNEGRSITSVLKNPNIDWPYPSITTMGYGNHAIRSENWRYIQYEDGTEELYDKRSDPLEWSNLASREQYVDIKQELKKWIPGVNNRIRMKEIGKRGQRKKSAKKVTLENFLELINSPGGSQVELLILVIVTFDLVICGKSIF